MSITIKDIAKLAGVSHTTVLKALNDKPKISEELREKIKQIAEQNNYIVNANARGLALKVNKVIGLVITDISIPLFAELTKAVEDIAREHGYNVLVCCSENDEAKENEAIMSLRELRVAGIIITPSYKGNKFVSMLNAAKMPFVVLGKLEGVDIDYITFDDKAATYKATKYLTEIGHRRIACVSTGEVNVQPFKSWIEGYREALEEADIKFDEKYIFTCDANANSGYRVVRDIISVSDMPTALVCFSDANAMGITRGLKDNKVNIPEDISLIVLQDNDTFKYCNPSLTALSFPKHELGQLATQYLLNKIEKKRGDKTNIMLPIELIVRESTCKSKE